MMLASLLAAALATPAPAGLDALRWSRRVLVLSAPRADDLALAAQRRALAGWRAGAAERDVHEVDLIGDAVRGVAGEAHALRGRLKLPADRFAVALVGKDGHVALRSATPVSAAALAARIDAMPMRRAGQR